MPRALSGVLLLTAFFAGEAGAQGGEPAMADHVVLISIDGLRPEFYLDGRWPAPRLRQMARDGAHARAVVSVFPSNTYPAHATMVSGVPPAVHGIVHNRPFQPEGPSGRWYWEHDSVRVKTLWEAVGDAGGSSAAFSWPVTVGAPVHWNVPEIWPPGSYDERLEAIRRSTTPPGFFEELEREATGRLVAWDSTGPTVRWAQSWWDERNADMAEYVLARYRPTLTAVHVVVADGAQHAHGREAPEVGLAVALADRVVSRLVDAARRAGILERTAFVVTGDHGFLGYDVVLAPNAWLVEAGLRNPEPGGKGEWAATFHGSGGSTFLRMRRAEDRETVARVRRILEGLPEGIRGRFRVVERDQLGALGADPEAVLALVAEDGSYFTLDFRRPAVRERSGAGHGHLPDQRREIHTGLIAWGCGVQEGAVLERARLTEVAPLVAALLGVELRELSPEVAEAILERP